MAKAHISRPESVCQRCACQFQKRGNSQKYCDDCRYTIKLERSRETHRRAALKAKTQVVGTPLICTVCGAEYLSRRGLRNKYCSRKCSRVVENAIRTAARRESGVAVIIGQPFPCQTCGAEVIARSPKSRYCERCLPEARRKTFRKHNRSDKRKRRIKQRLREDPKYAIDRRMGTAIKAALRAKKAGRPWESLVGYNTVDLMLHIERQFLPGMSWANMGRWHIDHIVPKAAFVYEDASDPEFKAAWALTNLRPLWAPANLSKGAKRLFLL